jgi:hypothetical protein
MLSLTSDDMPNFTYATPEEMRGAQEKALNLWVGATSPLWAPFWLSSAVGIGLWAWGQGFRRVQETVAAIPDSFKALSDGTTPTDVQGTVQNMVDDGVIAPIQTAGKAIQDVTAAVTPSPQAVADQVKSVADQVKTATDEATVKAGALGHAATSTVDKATTRAIEETKAQSDAAADVMADTGTLLTASAETLPKAAAAVAADTAVAPSDSDRPALRKPGSPKKS